MVVGWLGGLGFVDEVFWEFFAGDCDFRRGWGWGSDEGLCERFDFDFNGDFSCTEFERRSDGVPRPSGDWMELVFWAFVGESATLLLSLGFSRGRFSGRELTRISRFLVF